MKRREPALTCTQGAQRETATRRPLRQRVEASSRFSLRPSFLHRCESFTSHQTTKPPGEPCSTRSRFNGEKYASLISNSREMYDKEFRDFKRCTHFHFLTYCMTVTEFKCKNIRCSRLFQPCFNHRAKNTQKSICALFPQLGFVFLSKQF